MSKYTPLIDFLQDERTSQITLSFEQIDKLVDGLPPSARADRSWWGSSQSQDIHTWVHEWVAAGWSSTQIDLVREQVSFVRTFGVPVPSVAIGAYWWVNHKQTFKSEFEGGYIWSPRKNSNGAKNQTYDNLTLVKAGDIVLSYAAGEIKAIGIATAHHHEAPKPLEFGSAGSNWSNLGWLVPVHWAGLSQPLRPKNHLSQIQPLLPSKNSPLQGNGNGNQGCYLAAISKELGQTVSRLVKLGNPDALIALDEISVEIEGDLIQAAIAEDDTLLITEKEQIVKSRRGQGLFRQNVFKLEPRCRLTGVHDLSFLVASHIKPWKDCSNQERLDGNNGLMLAPHVDWLFDRGWISFKDNGYVLASHQSIPILSAWHLSVDSNVGVFSELQAINLRHHREHVFIGEDLGQS